MARTLFGDGSPYGLGPLGHAYAVAGKRDEALNVLKELETFSQNGFPVSYYIALVHFGLEEREQVFEWLEKALEERDWKMAHFLSVDPLWDQLRPDPRFSELLKKMKLEPLAESAQ